jgi:hypothetical protein
MARLTLLLTTLAPYIRLAEPAGWPTRLGPVEPLLASRSCALALACLVLWVGGLVARAPPGRPGGRAGRAPPGGRAEQEVVR